MNMRDLIPWTRGQDPLPEFFRDERSSPFFTLHREMNRLLEEAFRGFASTSLAGRRTDFVSPAWPKLEVAETEKQITVSAEIPGMEEKDVELLLNDGNLILRGEMKSETEDKERQFSERFYGRFERQIPVGMDIDENRSRPRSRTAFSRSFCQRPSERRRRQNGSPSTAQPNTEAWSSGILGSKRRFLPPETGGRTAGRISGASWTRNRFSLRSVCRTLGSRPHANAMTIVSTAMESPGFTFIFSTVASNSARKAVSIFIASMTQRVSPDFTAWPATTSIDLTRAGIGHRSNFEPPEAFFSGMSAASSTSRRVYTCASATKPACAKV